MQTTKKHVPYFCCAYFQYTTIYFNQKYCQNIIEKQCFNLSIFRKVKNRVCKSALTHYYEGKAKVQYFVYIFAYVWNSGELHIHATKDCKKKIVFLGVLCASYNVALVVVKKKNIKPE